MTRSTCRASFALAAGMLLTSAVGARGEEYRNADGHFSVQLPPGWERIPDDFLQQMNAFVRNLELANQFQYEAGFQRKGQPPGAVPYVLVQTVKRRMSGLSYDEIERGLAKEFNAPNVREVQGKLGDIVRDLSLGTPVLDREHNRVMVRMEMDALGVGRAQGLAALMLGSEGSVRLYCYASKADFAQSLPTFDALIDSFRYDPGYEFKPGGGFWGQVLAGAGEGAVVGGVAGALGELALVLVRRLKPARKRPAEEPPQEG